MSDEVKVPSLIVDPKTGDTARAEDILGEVQAVMKKYGYGLIFNPQKRVMVLAKVSAFGHEARVIAEVHRILPTGSVFKQIDWTPKPGQVQ